MIRFGLTRSEAAIVREVPHLSVLVGGFTLPALRWPELPSHQVTNVYVSRHLAVNQSLPCSLVLSGDCSPWLGLRLVKQPPSRRTRFGPRVMGIVLSGGCADCVPPAVKPAIVCGRLPSSLHGPSCSYNVRVSRTPSPEIRGPFAPLISIVRFSRTFASLFLQ